MVCLFGKAWHNNRIHFPLVQFPAVITSGLSIGFTIVRRFRPLILPRASALAAPFSPLSRSPLRPEHRRQSKNCFCTHFRWIPALFARSRATRLVIKIKICVSDANQKSYFWKDKLINVIVCVCKSALLLLRLLPWYTRYKAKTWLLWKTY